MIRGVFSVAGAVLLAVLLLRVVQGQMSLIDVAARGLVIVLAISLVDKVIAPTVGALLRGIGVMSEDESTEQVSNP